VLAIPQDKLKELEKLSTKTNVHALLRSIEIFSVAEADLKFSTHPKIIFETAAVKASLPQADYNIDALMARIATLEKKLEKGEFTAKTTVVESVEKVEKEPATTESTGTKEHWVCNVCGKLFADAEGTVEVKAEDLVIPKLEVPDILAPTVKDSENLNAVKVLDKHIYIDVTSEEGIKQDDLLKAIMFQATNEGVITYKFSDEAINLVQTGETLTITATNEDGTDVETYTFIVLGDVNSDGQILPNDATIILKNCVGNVGNMIDFATSKYAKLAAMLNSTEGVDPGDATIVLKKAVGKSYTTWLDE
jgi:hypothetical protein